MKNVLRAVAWLVLVMGAGAAQAYPIVTVGTQEWLQPADFLNVSWSGISAVCDSSTGVCADAPLAGAGMKGWIWASVENVNSLFNAVTGLSVMGPGATAFGPELYTFITPFTELGFVLTFATPTFSTIGGYSRDLSPLTQNAYRPYVSTNRSIRGTPWSWMRTNNTGGFITDCITPDETPECANGGGWFYRDASVVPPGTVPVPATLPLVGLTLIALAYIRRRRNKNV